MRVFFKEVGALLKKNAPAIAAEALVLGGFAFLRGFATTAGKAAAEAAVSAMKENRQGGEYYYDE